VCHKATNNSQKQIIITHVFVNAIKIAGNPTTKIELPTKEQNMKTSERESAVQHLLIEILTLNSIPNTHEFDNIAFRE
jgi:hypothetical protein